MFPALAIIMVMARGRHCTSAKGRPTALRAQLSGRTGGAASTADKDAKKKARIQARVKEAREQLSSGLDALTSTEQFHAYLKMVGRMPNYSAFNSLLIHWQMPDATHVASESAWKRMGRTRKQKAKPIRILAPRSFTRTETDPTTGEEVKVRGIIPNAYNTVSVYDVTQTEGKALPAAPTVVELTGDSPEAETLVNHLASWCTRKKIDYAGEAGGSNRYANGRLRIDSDMPRDQRALVFARESARAALQADGIWDTLEPTERDLACDGAAYAIAYAMGLDAGDYTLPHMAAVAADRRALERSLRAIQRATRAIVGDRDDDDTA